MISTRQADQAYYELFSVSRPFSEHLTKREDNQLRDKYDHNSFFYHGQPTLEEVRRALEYQKARGDGFFKLEGYVPLEHSFGMEQDITLTMVLSDPAAADRWRSNPDVRIQKPDYAQLEQLELRYYGPLYGDDFTVRNNRRLREKLAYHGAYLGERLVGCCYTCEAGEWVCMDSLLVADDSRRQYVATTLMKSIAAAAHQAGRTLYLHADQDDTPKDMYARMGFVSTDRSYEYTCTDFRTLKLD